jgi:hypothetical protein
LNRISPRLGKAREMAFKRVVLPEPRLEIVAAAPDISFDDARMAHDLAGRTGRDDLAEIHSDDAPHQLHEFTQAMLDDEDRQALALMQFADKRGERLDLARAETGERLIEQQQLRPGDELAGDFETAKIAVGQRVDHEIGLRTKSDAVEHVAGAHFRMSFGAHARRKTADDNVLDDRHTDEGTRQLKCSRQPTINDAMRRHADQRRAIELNRAAVRAHEAG